MKTIQLKGRIDSRNVADLEQQILASVSPGMDIELDASELDYISSAGLRMLMKLRKQVNKKYPVYHVSPEVYEIFEVTGFTELLDVHKRMREIDIEGAELIGKGGNGAVYRLDAETIVKVYFGISNPLEKIEQDRLVSRTAFVHGINTAIPYDVVKVGDSYGVVFEMVDADTLGQFIAKHPDQLEEYTHKMTQLLKQLHSTEFEEGTMPDARNLLYHRTDIIEKKGYLTHEEIRIMRSFIDSLPRRNTFVHVDFHPGNIMVKDDELVLIDVGDSGVGHPINDLMGMYLLYVVAPKAGSSEMYCGLGKEPLTRMWDQFLREYFETEEPAPYEKAIAGFASLKLIQGLCVNPGIPDEARMGHLAAMKGLFFDNIDKFVIVP